MEKLTNCMDCKGDNLQENVFTPGYICLDCGCVHVYKNDSYEILCKEFKFMGEEVQYREPEEVLKVLKS